MSDFKVLSDASHLLQRSGMYIGSTTLEEISGVFNGQWTTLKVVPGLIKIIEEIYQNSVDEFIRTSGKRANRIEVSIREEGVDGWWVTISDNGRGIPVVKHDGFYQAELCWTRARAGSNFNDDGRVTIGMNGVGSFATNVFSKKFIGESGPSNEVVTVTCSDNCSKIDTTHSKRRGVDGTIVKFQPDLERFGLDTITPDHITFIRDRLENLSICYPGLEFILRSPAGTEKILFKGIKSLTDKFKDSIAFEPIKGSIMLLAPSGESEEFKHLSFVNGIAVKNGGTHIDHLVYQITEQLRPMIKKKWKIEVLPNQIKQHLLVASWFNGFPNPKFDSQTKERITNTPGEINAFLTDFPAEKIAKQIMSTDAIINPMVESILYKKELAERLAAARAQKKNQKKKIANHIQAQHDDPEQRTLFITEGLSAIGMLLAVRDADKVGGYPLKGKVMNTRGMKPIDILKNKELSELMAVIGLEFGKKATDLNYGKIALMSDADPDGFAIQCLLINFFSHWPELFAEGRIVRCMTPLYIAKKGKTVKHFYSTPEFQAEALDKNWVVDYCKGLGTLDKETYKACINTPKFVTITASEADDMASLEMAFGGSADARKSWMMA